jgi:5-formyltetrahydrofolate cyclo-ligase
MNKNTLRTSLKSVVASGKEAKEVKIANSIFSLPVFLNAKSVGLFIALKNEPSLKTVYDYCLRQGKQVLLPVSEKEIKLALVTNQTQFIKKKLGVYEPKHPVFVSGLPQIIFVPMVAYDKNLNRLGHGLGYYDRLLQGRNVFKIGVSFSDYEVNEVPTDFGDVKMDIIITDNGIVANECRIEN